MPLSFCFDYGDKDNNKNQEKQNYQHFFVNRSLFSRTNGRWPKGKAICNSAAMSWGFAIPTSTVLFVNLSNRITNSFCGESKTCPSDYLILHSTTNSLGSYEYIFWSFLSIKLLLSISTLLGTTKKPLCLFIFPFALFIL